MKIILTLFLTMAIAMAAEAQQALDFAKKFMTMYEGDSMVKCITVSPKMMEQIAEHHPFEEGNTDDFKQAVSKLKSARIVNAPANYYERAELLLKKHARRFKAEDNFENDKFRGSFYTRKNRKGQTVELIMLREDNVRETMTIVCLTGDIDKEFLCFLYNNKSFKD